MSSSRSIAAARSRRAGETQAPISGGRPGTSIASHSAFVPQQQQQQQYQQMPPPTNVRVSKAPIQQQQQQPPPMPPNGSPFAKLSVSDAIGLITLRLGRVEQFIIDFENGEIEGSSNSNGIPENSKIIDNSVLTSMINRLDALEKKEVSSVANNEQFIKMEKDLRETKELLSQMSFKYELFTKETSDKFQDFEGAISEIEKQIEPSIIMETNEVLSSTIEIPISAEETLMNAADLKNLVKQELANSE